ncbi:hypothetical protein [Streptomyces virginiae]|uniref:hypothetical protein n=1 Tax=Streptomyces virginiae TaxID=1961 RepID=UPI0034442460
MIGCIGSFQTAHKRLIRWAVDGTWEKILTSVLAAADANDDIDWTGQWTPRSSGPTSTPPAHAKGGGPRW